MRICTGARHVRNCSIGPPSGHCRPLEELLIAFEEFVSLPVPRRIRYWQYQIIRRSGRLQRHPSLSLSLPLRQISLVLLK